MSGDAGSDCGGARVGTCNSDSNGSDLPEGVLLGMGNALLDMTVRVDKQFLDKYGLKENDAILAEDKHLPLFDEIAKRRDLTHLPGGATQNSLRIFQWIVEMPNRCTFFGSVGRDEYSDILVRDGKRSGVLNRYQFHPNIKTGTCAALIHNEHRSLVAHLSAANHFTIDHLEANWAYVENARYIYVSGFFLTVCPEAVKRVGEHAASTGKSFCMNLAAAFIPQAYKAVLNDAMQYVDLLFANRDEAMAYNRANDYNVDCVSRTAQMLSALPKKNQNRARLVVITQGGDRIITCRNNNVTEFAPLPIDEREIVDTNGAGDAFCGGFLAEYVRNSTVERCIRCAIYAAGVVLRNQGCTVDRASQYGYGTCEM